MIFTIGFSFLVSILFVIYSIKKTIYVSQVKQLFDEPAENRKIHILKTPNLGGAAIFASLILTSSLFVPAQTIHHLNYIFGAGIILFLTGLTDDLVGMNPFKKFVAQLVVSLIVTIFADARFTDFHGILGFHDVPYGVSVAISVLFIMLLVNAFNLIDGINSLAASLGILVCLVFAFLFWKLQEPGFVLLAIIMAGSLVGFLIFNWTPAKIFMGDSGSLLLGFVIAIFSISFIEKSKLNTIPDSLFKSAPAIVLSILIVPIFDTLRVFTIRILSKKSPFSADKNHIHHLLVDLNLTHLQTTGILLLVNIGSVMLAFLLSSYRIEISILVIIAFAISLYTCLWWVTVKKQTQTFQKKIKVFEVSSELSSG